MADPWRSALSACAAALSRGLERSAPTFAFGYAFVELHDGEELRTRSAAGQPLATGTYDDLLWELHD